VRLQGAPQKPGCGCRAQTWREPVRDATALSSVIADSPTPLRQEPPPLPDPVQRVQVPPSALLLSLGALAVPVAGALFFDQFLGEYVALLWLTALVPAFLLTYHRGWRGAAAALALGMAVLSVTQAVVLWTGGGIPETLAGTVAAYVAIALGVGWLGDRTKRERVQIQQEAYTDPLTGLPNRRHALSFLESEFAAAHRGRPLSLVVFDLDRFRSYNERHGEGSGDTALLDVSVVLAATTRRMNLSGRIGGEEFLSVLAGTDWDGALTFADRVLEGFRSRRKGRDNLTISAGVATFHPSMASPADLLEAAEHALYRAKQGGRNTVRLFGEETAPEVPGPLGWEVPLPPLPEATWEERPTPEALEPTFPRDPSLVGSNHPSVSVIRSPTPFGTGRRVLLVEDDEQIRGLIAAYLAREGFQVDEAPDGATGLRSLAAEHDLVITDVRLPDSSGNDLVAAVKSRWPATQVVVMTGAREAEVAAEALNAGADRYIFKPFAMSDLRGHIADALARRGKILEEGQERRRLSQEAQERADQAREAILRGARALVLAVEVRDPYTRGHSTRVAHYSCELARRLKGAPPLELETLRLACELHDVGKIGVSDAILNKETTLEPEEFLEVERHPRVGRRILEPLLDDELVLAVVSWHHERWDGRGYPDGLAGESIPLAARITGLADALDAMTSRRAYRSSRSWEAAVREIRSLWGSQFDPGLAEAFEEALPTLERSYRESRGGG